MNKKLYVGGLSYGTSEDALRQLFAQSGQVAGVKVIVDHESGRSKGFAFVEMSSDSEAKDAISRFDGQEFDGRRLAVNEARPQAARENRSSRW